jgi:hypothetical protein
MSTHLLTPSPCQAVKNLRSCLSPSRSGRSASPSRCTTARSPSSDGGWFRKRKCVRWEGEIGGNDVTSYFATYSATEYDRTPLAPPSQAERSCVLPERGSRCLNYGDSEDDAEEEEEDEEDEEEETAFSDSETGLPPSPFATPEDSDSEDRGDEWSECFARRRMMFSRLCPTRDGPEFEGYRSLSSTLVDLLRSVDCDDDEQIASREASDEDDADHEGEHDHEHDDPTSPDSELPPSSPLPVSPYSPVGSMGDFFLRLRDCHESDTGTPSLISSADSDGECPHLASPRGSAIDFLPSTLAPCKQSSTTVSATFVQVTL